MASPASNQVCPQPHHQDRHRKKLPRLPQTARITKRPLLRPAIPSPRAGASHSKVVYVSAHTSFIPVIKRVEKLLHLADQRTTQSATTATQNNSRKGNGLGKRKRGRGDDGGEDELLEIARTAERQRKEGGGTGGEEVVIKGTGKAVQKVLEFGLWFQQREDRFRVQLRTSSVGAIDDIEVDEQRGADNGKDTESMERGEEQGGDGVPPDGRDSVGMDDAHESKAGESEKTDPPKPAQKTKDRVRDGIDAEVVPETRMRYTSSLEVSVRLR